MDDLIAQLKARAADPDRRVDVQTTEFFAGLQALDLRGLFGALRDIRGDLSRALDASREGRVDPQAHARAQEIERAMSTPVEAQLPPPADDAALDAAEESLGASLPSAFRRIYREVANGGFGPGPGLLSIEQAVKQYGVLRAPDEMPDGCTWPQGLLPLVHHDPAWECLETATGRIIDWDPEELEEWSDETQFMRSFTEIAPGIEAWLREWVGSETVTERMPEQMASAKIQAARSARDQVAAMTPEERAKLALPEEGWEEIFLKRFGVDPEDLGEA